MPDPKRLEFVTLHFRDLQRIRLLPIQLVLTLAVVEHRPPITVPVAWAMLCGFFLGVPGFFWWSTAAIRRRYGAVKLSRMEELRMRSHPVIIALYLILAAGLWWAQHILHLPYGHGSYSDFYLAGTVLIFMLSTILDATNLRSRRVVYAIGTLVLFAVVPFTTDVLNGKLSMTIAGTVWLSLSLFDFQLLRRSFAGVPV
jgi:hypothetical protein